MLLEEALLNLLRSAGYKTVEGVGDDPTLQEGSAGLEVKGRGTYHQIDAIADFEVQHPFGNPNRLLIEAKCFSPREKVGLPIVREAVGVLKDVSEFWFIGVDQEVPKQRYHYQYAIFSATGYTPQAERYAFAQDIYLIPLAESLYFRPVTEAIRGVSALPRYTREGDLPLNLREARAAVREALRRAAGGLKRENGGLVETVTALDPFLIASRATRFALLAILGERFPVFLIPSPNVREQGIQDSYRIRIFRDDRDITWYLRNADTNVPLFSFDLPPKLFQMYADQGMLRTERALDLKANEMAVFRALFVRGGEIRVIRFTLDLPWVEDIRMRLRARRIEEEG
jgi:hypothetical protein